MMVTYTVRFAHLEGVPVLQVGDSVFRGDVVGRMGSSGESKFNHLHLDVVQGSQKRIIRLYDIGYTEMDIYKPDIIQLNYFIDDELFGIVPVITTPFYDPGYAKKRKKNHPAYDLVPKDRHAKDEDGVLKKEHFDIHWNRSRKGVVLAKGYDKNGYGNYILIGF